MKRLIVIVALFVATNAHSAGGNPLQERLCTARADAAAQIMAFHQNGVPKKTVVSFNNNEKDRNFFKDVTELAYASTKRESDQEQRKAVETFRSRILKDCITSDLDKGPKSWQRW